jgi:thiol-disulfide isomerase/thioredoxin
MRLLLTILFWLAIRVRFDVEMQMAKVLAITVLLLLPSAKAQEATDISWHDTRGNVQSISRYKGKIVVLNFWATWCVPCRHEMPMLAEMQRKYADQGLVVLGGSVDDVTTEPQIQPYGEKSKISFPLLVGATSEQMKQMQLGESIPATAFFDADGKLVGRVLGELNKSELQHRIEWMLGKHKGTEPPAFVNGFENKPKPKCGPPVFTH